MPKLRGFAFAGREDSDAVDPGGQVRLGAGDVPVRGGRPAARPGHVHDQLPDHEGACATSGVFSERFPEVRSVCVARAVLRSHTWLRTFCGLGGQCIF